LPASEVQSDQAPDASPEAPAPEPGDDTDILPDPENPPQAGS